MAWVSVHQQVRDHRKTRALFRELNISRAEAIGTLVLLWTWALDNCDETGKLLSCTIDDIAAASYWNGNPCDLYNALVKVRWIDDVGGDIFVHDWNDFNKPFHDYIERKAKDRLRKQRKNSAGNTTEIPQEAPQEFHVSPSPSPSPSPAHIPSQQEEREDTTPSGGVPIGTHQEADRYQQLYDHYMTLGLIKHKALTKEMRNAIDIAVRRCGYDWDMLKQLLDRHAYVVNITAHADYPVEARGLAVFFGQKVRDGSLLICSEYADDGAKWLRYKDGILKKSYKESKNVNPFFEIAKRMSE